MPTPALQARPGRCPRPGASVKGVLALVVLAVSMIAAPRPSVAEPGRIVSKEYKISIAEPEAADWRRASVPDGTICAFGHKSALGAHVELRASPRISGGLKSTYLAAFVHQAESAWTLVEEPHTTRYGALEGSEVRFLSDGGREDMVAFVFFRKNFAYLVVGYFPSGSWDKLYPVYQQMIQTIGFTK